MEAVEESEASDPVEPLRDLVNPCNGYRLVEAKLWTANLDEEYGKLAGVRAA
jgi:hypothetical protein